MKALRSALAACAVILAAGPPAGALELSGSLAGTVAYVALRDTEFSPDSGATLADYAASTVARIAVDSGERSRLSFEARCLLNAVDRSVSLETLHAYAEVRIGEQMSLGLGRRLVGFGCGLVWNPANGVDAPRNPFDRAASRPGLDAAFVTLELASATGFPLSLSLQAIAPPYAAGIDVAKGTLAAQAYAYVRGIELSVVGDCADLAGERPRWSVGGWGTLDLAGLVLGLEVAYRRSDRAPHPDDTGLPVTDQQPHLWAVANASFRLGHFYLYAEGFASGAALSIAEAERVASAPVTALPAYAFITTPGSIGRWHATAGVEWSRDPVSCGLGVLADIEEAAGAAFATAAWEADDTAVVRLKGTVPVRSSSVSEYDFLPFRWTASLSVEAYF